MFGVGFLLVEVDFGFDADFPLPFGEGELVVNGPEVFTGNVEQFGVEEQLKVALCDVEGDGLYGSFEGVSGGVALPGRGVEACLVAKAVEEVERGAEGEVGTAGFGGDEVGCRGGDVVAAVEVVWGVAGLQGDGWQEPTVVFQDGGSLEPEVVACASGFGGVFESGVDAVGEVYFDNVAFGSVGCSAGGEGLPGSGVWFGGAGAVFSGGGAALAGDGQKQPEEQGNEKARCVSVQLSVGHGRRWRQSCSSSVSMVLRYRSASSGRSSIRWVYILMAFL